MDNDHVVEKRAGPSSSSDDGAPTPSLATFIQGDIHPPQGQRVVLPFITTTDRLRLSECSQGFVDYRYSLTRVQIVPRVSPIPGIERSFEQLLLNQHGLEYLRVCHMSMLRMLELGCFQRLQTLDLPYLAHDRADNGEAAVGYVSRALGGGGLRGLEDLNLSSLGTEGFDVIVGHLKNGVCPHLRRLNIATCSKPDFDVADAMAEALASGHLKHLEELNLSGNCITGGIARALRGGACPQLVKLHLRGCKWSEQAGRALGEAIRSGACAKLEYLNLANNYFMGDESFMAILGALAAGSCPSLRHLNLYMARLSVQSATAMAHALLWSANHLQVLELERAFNGSSALHVLPAIQQGMPNLLRLNMFCAHIDMQGGRVLGEAIGAGALPKLEELRLGLDSGVLSIMMGLEVGGCRRLKMLDVRNMSMRPQDGYALARALASGHLNCLQTLDVSENQNIGDVAMAEVIKGLRECQQLRQLQVDDTGMGVMAGQVLVQALQVKAWPDLTGLGARSNESLLSSDVVVMDLVVVLERRAEHCPRLKRVSFGNTGLNENREAGARLSKLLKEI